MDKRTGLAIGLCIVFFFLWYWLIEPALGLRPPPRKPVPKAPAAAPAAAPPAAEAKAEPKPPPVLQPEVKPQAYPDLPPVPFEVGRFKGEFSVQGGGLKSLALRSPDGKGEVPLLSPLEPGRPHFALRHVKGPVAIEGVPWKIHEEKRNESIEFLYLLPNGVQVTKKFTLDPAKYSLGLVIYMTNTNAPAEGRKEPPEQEMDLELLAFNGLVPDGSYRHEQYMTGVVYRGKRTEFKALADVEKGETRRLEAERIKGDKERDDAIRAAEEYVGFTGPDRDWMGLKNRFFAAVLAPTSDPTKGLMDGFLFRSASKEAREKGDKLKNLNAVARARKVRVGGAPVAMEFTAYLGPIQAAALREAPAGGDKLLDYGAGCGAGCGPVATIFAPLAAIVQLVAPIILGILNFFGRDVFGNYGVGIIVTTILIRACLFPLSKKSQEAAFKMQKLGPQIELLRQRYGDDRQKFGMEQWKLFKEHKIHPASGCLPMFLQLPIFVGMYSVFELSVELRRAPFMLWIRDLSQPDALARFSGPVNVPILPTFDSFNVLPIVMTITWFLQSWFAPRSPDPQMQTQQKMMMAMPVVFGIMCYNLASGLSLYFLVNSLLGMAEQKIIKKFFLKPSESPSRP